MLLVPNRDVVIPFAKDIRIIVPKNNGNFARQENRATYECNAVSFITLGFTPVANEWIEVFVDGFRLLNPRIKSIVGGNLFENYNMVGNRLVFAQPITGQVTVVCDTKPLPAYNTFLIEVNNVQGKNSARASLYIEPVIMAEPYNGYARLSADRMSMVYLPRTGFTGHDSFSYCLINNLGQYSKNFCVYIKVTPARVG